MRKSLLGLAAVAAFAAAPAQASIDIYSAALLGTNEVAPTVGDADGWGGATLIIDNVANTISWSFLAMNIAPALTGAHIHAGAAGVNGGVVVNFSSAYNGSGLFDGDLALITPASAPGFYVNLHNAAHGGGAIRGQLTYERTVNPPVPEPETYLMLLAGVGAIGMVARRRRKLA